MWEDLWESNLLYFIIIVIICLYQCSQTELFAGKFIFKNANTWGIVKTNSEICQGEWVSSLFFSWLKISLNKLYSKLGYMTPVINVHCNGNWRIAFSTFLFPQPSYFYGELQMHFSVETPSFLLNERKLSFQHPASSTPLNTICISLIGLSVSGNLQVRHLWQ